MPPVFAAFMPGILFDPEDWGGKFFWNIGGLLTNYTPSQARRLYAPYREWIRYKKNRK
jgi:hypothetical protein